MKGLFSSICLSLLAVISGRDCNLYMCTVRTVRVVADGILHMSDQVKGYNWMDLVWLLILIGGERRTIKKIKVLQKHSKYNIYLKKQIFSNSLS